MRIRFANELWPIAILATLFAIIAIVLPSSVARIVLGIPLVLFLPGYSLTTLLFPRKTQLTMVERLALSFGLSLAAVPLLGLVLSHTGWGVKFYPVLIVVVSLIIIASMAAWARRRALPPEERPTPSLYLHLGFWKSYGRADRILFAALAVAVLAALGTSLYVMAVPKGEEKFTEFYIRQIQNKGLEQPGVFRLGEKGVAIVGIRNHQKETEGYRIEVRVDGVENSEFGPIRLEDGQKWEGEVGFTPLKEAGYQKVELMLYREGENQAAAQASFWVKVITESS